MKMIKSLDQKLTKKQALAVRLATLAKQSNGLDISIVDLANLYMRGVGAAKPFRICDFEKAIAAYEG